MPDWCRSFDVVVRPTFMGTLRWDNFCNFGATLLRFGTLLSNIILPWIRNFEKKSDLPNHFGKRAVIKRCWKNELYIYRSNGLQKGLEVLRLDRSIDILCFSTQGFQIWKKKLTKNFGIALKLGPERAFLPFFSLIGRF